MVVDLTEDNCLLLAAKYYETNNYLSSEFEDDMSRIKYLKRLFRQYRKKNVLRDRLILNHIVCLSNVLGVEFLSRILFLKLEIEDFPAIKTFLVYLNFMPEMIEKINGRDIHSSDIEIDFNIAKILRSL